MENKPNQPNSGANPSQSTGANKSSSSASMPQSGNMPQGQNDRMKPSSATSAGASGSQASTATSSTDSSTRSQNQDQSRSRSQQGSQDANKPAAGGQEPSWMNVSSWMDGTNQIPQSVKDLGTKALDQVNKLTTTQKVVGGALLVSGLSWLALRSKSQPKSSKPSYRSNTDYRSNSDYRSGRAYGSTGASSGTTDQQFQGPYGNSPTRGVSDNSYSTKSSTDYRNSGTDSGYRSGSTRSDSASSSGFGEDDYSSDL